MSTATDSLIALTKKRLRSKMLSALKKQKEEERLHKSRIIKDKLFRTKWFRQARYVMFYVSMPEEVETRQMIEEAGKKGKIIVVPVCEQKRTIKPCMWDKEAELQKGPYGIAEPIRKQEVPLEKLDLVVVPALAFDNKGRRLGRGKGYYDAFLSRLTKKTKTIGIAFDFQILPQVPVQKQDVPVDKIIYA